MDGRVRKVMACNIGGGRKDLSPDCSLQLIGDTKKFFRSLKKEKGKKKKTWGSFIKGAAV